ncbi:unnamed protein product [Nippostrongylus brasiliensis]|uniref:Low-density lipoprotein receptor domain class A n=1 Tax=Nippostrongylus brasiliensis TaxID=27835 RepID=A0A0N4YRC9_NIPBR|nr:unnamed protein product [Nippostrongylus brasiliensis]
MSTLTKIFLTVLVVASLPQSSAFSIRELIRGGKRGDSSTPCPTWHPFECPSGECVPIKYLCDGSPDCSDEYDENKSMCTAGKVFFLSSVPTTLPLDPIYCNRTRRSKSSQPQI